MEVTSGILISFRILSVFIPQTLVSFLISAAQIIRRKELPDKVE